MPESRTVPVLALGLAAAVLLAVPSAQTPAPSRAQTPAPAPSAPAPPAQRRAVPATPAASDVPRVAFQKFTLPNGLDVIISQDHRLPLVGVNVWYHVGPANEEPGRTGFAHLFEHLMFQGSKHTPPDSHFSMLEAAGATDVNGTTDYDRTNYFETVPVNQLELALWIESDRMGYLLDTIDQAALSNQQDVVRNERRQSFENQPYGMARETLVQMLYPTGHPYYGNIIGSHDDIQAAKLEDVRQFFKRYYAPSNASLAIVGDIDPVKTRALVEKYFGTLKRGPQVPPVRATTPPITAERRTVVKDRIQLPRVYMGWLAPSIYTPGDAEGEMTGIVLGGGRSGRLYKKLVYEKQIAQDVFAFQQSLLLGSQFQIVATARPGHTLEELEAAIDEELAAIRNAPPQPAELERARNQVESQVVQGLESLGGFGGVADLLNSYNHYLKDPGFLPKDMARYRGVTPAAVQAFAREHLVASKRVVVQVVPGEPDPVPAGPAPAPAASAAAAQGGGEAVNADEPWRATVPQAGAAKAVSLPTPQIATLSNGLTLILNERHERPVVAANLVVRTGSDVNPPDKSGLASFAVSLLDDGTATRGALEIADEVARLGASLSTGTTTDATTVSVRSLKKTFTQALGLAADVTLRPAFPAAEIERERQARLGQLAQQRQNANAIAGRVVATVLYGDTHPYGMPEIGTEASIKAVTRDELVGYWRQTFVPNNSALVVAGDITMPELRALAERTFGSWQRGAAVTPTLTPPTPPTSRIVIVNRPGAPQTQLRVAGIGAARSSPDFRAIQLMNTALGGLFSSRINMNLREANGYTYGANSNFAFRKSAGPFQVATGVRTDVTAPAVTEILKELRGIVDRPVTADELRHSKDALSYSLAGAFETSRDAVGSFSNVFIYDLGLDYYTRYAASVNAVTVDQTAAAARKYLVPEQLVVVAVGDQAKIEPELRKLGLPVEIRDADGRLVGNAGAR